MRTEAGPERERSETGRWWGLALVFAAVPSAQGGDDALGPVVAAALESLDAAGYQLERDAVRIERRARSDVLADFDRQLGLAYSDGFWGAMPPLLALLGLPNTEDADTFRAGFVQGSAGVQAAYYDVSRRALVLLDEAGAGGARESELVLHELAHAWRDRDGAIRGLLASSRGTFEGTQIARMVTEGDAQLVELLCGLRAGGRGFPSGGPLAPTAQLDSPALVEQVYGAGLEWAGRAYRRGGRAAIDAAFERLPASTEAIFHSGKRTDAPTAVRLPPWPGAEPPAFVHEDVFGEAGVRFVLTLTSGAEPLEVHRAAAGWDGDRLRVARARGGPWTAVWRTFWDRPSDAEAFAALLGRRAAGTVAVRGAVVDWSASDDGDLAAELARSLADDDPGFRPSEEDARSTIAAEAAREAREPRLDAGTFVSRGARVPAPEGWSARRFGARVFLMAPAADGFADNLVVSELAMRGAGGAEALAALADRTIAGVPGGEVLARTTLQVDGRPARRIDYSHRTRGVAAPLHGVLVCVEHGGLALALEFQVLGPRWEDLAGAVDAALAATELD